MSSKLRVSANLAFLFKELDFVSRLAAASNAGFRFVECGDLYCTAPDALVSLCNQHKLSYILLNVPPGPPELGGGLGLAAVPGAESIFQENVRLAVRYADALQCTRINLMAGNMPPGSCFTDCEQCYLKNVAWAVDFLAEHNITTLIEPLCKAAAPNWFLSSFDQALRYIEQLKKSTLKIEVDMFHLQMSSGNVTNWLKKLQPHIDHIQVAQAPDRGEPGSRGELSYDYVFDLIRDIGYTGFIGAEYVPSTGSSENSFGWIEEYGLSF